MRAVVTLYYSDAFIRHSALPDPLDLDSRGGETHEWPPANVLSLSSGSTPMPDMPLCTPGQRKRCRRPAGIRWVP